MEAKHIGAIIGSLVAVLIILTIALVTTSLEKLNSFEVGLKYNTNWKSLASSPSGEGLHTGPPGFEFIIFPNVLKSIEFSSLRCLNKEGVTITLSISYQYKIRVQHLREIVEQFRDHDKYVVILRYAGVSAIYEACSLFNTSQFQAERGSFQETVSAKVSDRYDAFFCDISETQVSNIDRPSSYESAIQAKESAREHINIVKNERPRKLLQAETTKREAETHANITIAKAQSDARIIVNRAEATAAAILNEYNTEAETYLEVMSSDGLGLSEEAFISYMGIRTVAEAKNPVYIGMKGPAKTSYATP